jgi:hypothetical protein
MGLMLTLMVIASSYIPFFILLIFVCFLLACSLAARHWIMQGVRSILAFMREAPWAVMLYVLALLMTCVPSILWFQEAHSGQYVLMVERAEGAGQDVAQVPLRAINEGGLATQASWQELFTDFNAVNNSTAYVPVLLFVLFLLSFLNRACRVGVVLLLTGIMIAWIAMANVTPVHAFLL